MDQFSSAGPLVALFKDFGNLISGYITEKLYLVMADFMDAIGKSGMADAFRYQAETSANEVKTALDVIPIHAELTAEKAGESMGNIPESFKANMEGVPPLFTVIEEHQAEIDRLTQSITTSQNTQTVAVDETSKAQAAAEQEARKYFDEYQKGQAKAAEVDAEKAAKQAEQNALKQQELAFQLEFATAQATGDTEHMAALTAQKKWLEDYQKALAAGLGEDQAQNFATNMAIAAANSANIKQYDKDGNQLFFKAAENAGKLNESLKSATGFADTLSKMQEIKAMDKAANSAKAATEELRAMDKLLGTDLAQKSFPDLVKKLNIDKMGMTGEQQIAAVVNYMNGVKTKLSQNPINSKAGQEAINQVKDSIEKSPFKGKLAMDNSEAKAKTANAFSKFTTTLDAEKSVTGIRDSVKDGIELDVAAKSGATGLLEMIKTAVEAIKTAVEKIEPKLPTAALI
jgi:hypothetical protein